MTFLGESLWNNKTSQKDGTWTQGTVRKMWWADQKRWVSWERVFVQLVHDLAVAHELVESARLGAALVEYSPGDPRVHGARVEQRRSPQALPEG